MATKAGVWIDHRQAFVVLISDLGEQTKRIESNSERPARSAAGSHTNKPENMREHKFSHQLNAFYDEVITHVEHADSILVFGPGEAKGEFRKRLQGKKASAQVVESEAADKMTEPQIAAHVRQHFQDAPV